MFYFFFSLNFTKNVNEVNHSMWYEDISNYSTIELEHGVSKNTMLCHNDLCCQLIYSITCPQSEVNCDTYRLLSYSGLRSLGGGAYTIYIQVFKYAPLDFKACELLILK